MCSYAAAWLDSTGICIFKVIMCGVVSTEFPHLTAATFENCLASDGVLVHFFNAFLSLPSFPEAVLYNQETGLFEVESGAAELVSRRIRSALHHRKLQLLAGDPVVLMGTPPVDNHYTIYCLDKEQGIQWIVKERLPFFLQSDCYIEYRLAKLLFQWDLNLCIQRRKTSLGRTTLSTPLLCCSSQLNKDSNNLVKVLPCLHSLENISAKQESMKTYNFTRFPSGQEEHIDTKCSKSSGCFCSCSKTENPCTCSSSSILKCETTLETQSPQMHLSSCVTEPSAGNLNEHYHQEFSSLNCQSSDLQVKHLATSVIKLVVNNALSVMDGQSQSNISNCLSNSGDQTDYTTEKSCLHHPADGDRETLEGKKEKVQDGKNLLEEQIDGDKKNEEVKSEGTGKENIPGIYCHDDRPGLDEFKEFLRGTPGETMINFWMDIEKLKTLQSREQKNRYLVLMRSRYLLSSSRSSLNAELLSRLGLATSPCWTEEKLCSVQPCLTEALLFYWAPRFWTSQCVQGDHDDAPNVGLRTEWYYSPPSGGQPYCSFLALPLSRHDTCLPPSSNIVHTELYSSTSDLLGGRGVEQVLQALCFESRAGLYFTRFCEQSGNQLWENAVYFWTDLQHYHELFYQDGMDPYRVQREAQLLYATYLNSSARRSIGVDEGIRREVYNRLMPAFEELFDEVEEHALNILLQPWTLLVSRDKESFQKVSVQEEVRTVDSQEYRELQSMYQESESRRKQVEKCGSTLFLSPVTCSTGFSKAAQAPESWSSVSPNYQGYRLGSLLRHRPEIGHFMSFLQNQDASIHLTCWLDLEQYRRTQKDTAVKQERSSNIATRYLNRMYFFGPNSPASAEQQNDILRLAGGLERLTLESLSNSLVVKIQDIVRTHIEKTWLPQFLTTAEFTQRQQHKPEPQARAADQLSQYVYRQRRARREPWKAGGQWMSSSREILLFRQILLNPVTCMQFQHFISLKGDFLENDVLFWLEVQRYKDLCHSHSDEATIQQKVSTIIRCFIDSSTPPTLQIDIPPEQAQYILEKRHELGPYIFREAQQSVFNELLKFWPEFQELSNSVQEERLLPLLQEKRAEHRAEVRRHRRKEEERRRAKEELETQESSVREEDTGDVAHVEERSEAKQLRTQSTVLQTPTKPLSWSYSKYMAALKREELLLKRQSQLEASFSTASDSSDYSVGSAGSRLSYR